MFVITNATDTPIMVDGVYIDSEQQLEVEHLTDDMNKPGIVIKSSTLEDRKADTKAIEEGIEAMEKITNG